MDPEIVCRNLAQRGFLVSRFSRGTEAADYLASAIQGRTVGLGGSKTLEAIGIFEKLAPNNTVFWHWKAPGPETLRNAAAAEIYLSSANAISEDGQIVNIDGTGNRLSSLLFGHEKVYIVAGINKIAPDFNAALFRARNVAAVRNCARFGKNTPCQKDGHCHDCRSPERICRALSVLWGPMNGMETEVVLIEETLGM